MNDSLLPPIPVKEDVFSQIKSVYANNPVSVPPVTPIATPSTDTSSNVFSQIKSVYSPSSSELPDDVVKAQNYVNNPEMNQHAGLCQQFVEQVTQGKTGIWPSAIDAWNGQQDKAVKGLGGIKPGDPIYFAPDSSNEGWGHVGIYQGDNKFISATDNGVQTHSLAEWNQLTGQQPLGYIPQGGKQ